MRPTAAAAAASISSIDAIAGAAPDPLPSDLPESDDSALPAAMLVELPVNSGTRSEELGDC